ncbi:MAG: cupin domain-containing protein [Dehalococcoidia bacterium]
MQYVRLYAGPDGESHFEDVDLALVEAAYAPPALPMQVSAPTPATRSLFIALHAGYDSGRHPSPVRQWVIVLAGVIAVEASDGEVRRFPPGGLALLEDLTGQGHDTRVVGPDEARFVSVHLVG